MQSFGEKACWENNYYVLERKAFNSIFLLFLPSKYLLLLVIYLVAFG